MKYVRQILIVSVEGRHKEMKRIIVKNPQKIQNGKNIINFKH